MKDPQQSAGSTEVSSPAIQERSSSFVDNMKLPIHRWFRYSAGFSAQWVQQEIQSFGGHRPIRLLDPFAGAGTTLLAAESVGIESRGIEAHPFVFRIAGAKLLWRTPAEQFEALAQKLIERAQLKTPAINAYAPLIQKCYPPESLEALDQLRRAWQESEDGEPASKLAWLAINGILRACSPVGTAQWQYVLPRKEKATCLDPFVAFQRQIQQMASDMRRCTQDFGTCCALLSHDDARTLDSVPDQWANLVITSPPYTNNYDYADATRLEMSFWGEVSGWGDLQRAVRTHLIRCCTQHVSADGSELETLLAMPDLECIRGELQSVCAQLAAQRIHHGGKKPYHLMVAAYFSDLAQVWKALRRVTTDQASVCFVVGDSAPYGIHVPVERWLGQMAMAAGFSSFRFEKTRDRNTKWKNRKHTVPLHEGRLWVQS